MTPEQLNVWLEQAGDKLGAAYTAKVGESQAFPSWVEELMQVVIWTAEILAAILPLFILANLQKPGLVVLLVLRRQSADALRVCMSPNAVRQVILDWWQTLTEDDFAALVQVAKMLKGEK